MLTILPYLLSVYGRSKCTLSTCPVFGEYFKPVAPVIAITFITSPVYGR